MVSHDGTCESCDADDVRTSSVNVPDGQSFELCYQNGCMRKVQRWWREWAQIQPEQAEMLARRRRDDERHRERQAVEGAL